MATNKKNNSPYENARNAIISKRLNMDKDEAGIIFDSLPKEIAKLLSIQESAVISDMEISGRNMDFLFTINKQNKPKKL